MRPADYTVRLAQVFQGPMDLLLHLVREQEVEIHEIEISKVVDGYLAYLNGLEELDIEYAADFLVMAATLMAIKSRSLLPHEELDLEEELDPKDELIQRLIEYRRFKAAADDLQRGWHERTLQVERGLHDEVDAPDESEFELGELTVWDLLSTYSRLMRETLADRPHHVSTDPRPLRFYVDELVARLRSGPALSLRSMMKSLENVPRREALVGSFCALLELARMELIDIGQEEGDDIVFRLRKEHEGDLDEIVANSMFDEEIAEALADGEQDYGAHDETAAAGEPNEAQSAEAGAGIEGTDGKGIGAGNPGREPDRGP